MVDPITGTGLASSILTIIEIGYRITRRTVEFSCLLGELPPDLQSCKDLVDIIVRTGKRLQRKDSTGIGDEIVHGPPTELEADLEVLFDNCCETATSLLEVLGGFEDSGALSKAIKLARKKGKIVQIRNRLDQHVLAILLVLGERQNKSDRELRDIAFELKKNLHRFHEDIVSRMSASYQQLEIVVRDSRDSLLRDLRLQLLARDQDFKTSSLRLLGGQQDLSENLDRIEQNLCQALQNGETFMTARMQGQSLGQQPMTRTLFDSASQCQDAMHSHMKQLHEELTIHPDALERIQETSCEDTRQSNFQAKASFGIVYRSDFLAFHVSHGIGWVSSILPSPKTKSYTTGNIYVLKSRMQPMSEIACGYLDILIEENLKQNGLLGFNTSKYMYKHETFSAVAILFRGCRCTYWRLCPVDYWYPPYHFVNGIESYRPSFTALVCVLSFYYLHFEDIATSDKRTLSEDGKTFSLREKFLSYTNIFTFFGIYVISMTDFLYLASYYSNTSGYDVCFLMPFIYHTLSCAVLGRQLLALWAETPSKPELTKIKWMHSWLAFMQVYDENSYTWQQQATFSTSTYLLCLSLCISFVLRIKTTGQHNGMSFEWKTIRLPRFSQNKGAKHSRHVRGKMDQNHNKSSDATVSENASGPSPTSANVRRRRLSL